MMKTETSRISAPGPGLKANNYFLELVTTTSVGNVYLAGASDAAIDFGSGNSTAKGTFIIELSQ